MTVKDYARMLVATNPETVAKIKEYEEAGRFNDHLDSLEGAVFTPVDGSFEYVTKSPRKKLVRFLQRQFIVNPFRRYTNKLFQTEVVGKENLKGVSSAIVCSNHVNKLDCMAICHALRPKKVYTVAAQFNNMDGFLGDMMRVGGMLPLSDNYAAMKHLDEAISHYLAKGNFITFFPEQSEWWGYEKPRPLLNGAYHYARKNNVPVLPLFITFRETPASRASETGLKQFVVHILPPLYAAEDLTGKAAVEDLKARNAAAWKKAYETFYGKPLSIGTAENTALKKRASHRE